MDMEPSAEGLDFGNSDEDYSEDSDFEYDYVDENDNPIKSSKLPNNAALKAMMTNSAAHDAALPDTEAGDLDHDEDFPEIEEIQYADDEEDSDWEDDPTGYQDPADPRAAAGTLGPSTATSFPVPATVPSFTSITTNPLTSLGILPTTAQLTHLSLIHI